MLLGLGIALGIVPTLIAEIVSRIVHKTTIFEDDDERDKLIDVKSAWNAAYAFALSFFGAMAFAAFELTEVLGSNRVLDYSSVWRSAQAYEI